MSDPVVRTMIAYPAEWDCRSDASALSRALAIHDAVPDEYRPSDSEPLRNCLPGIWPTVGDLRATLSGQQGGAGLRPEGTKSGLEAAIKIVVDEMETVSSLSPSYERLQAILVGLHGELRRAKSHD